MSPERFEQFLDFFADALADRVAERLGERLEATAPQLTNGVGTAGLLTLDQLVAELPPAKRPQTWKRWLYERTRRGEVPGAVKLAGSWYFDPDQARAWIVGGADGD